MCSPPGFAQAVSLDRPCGSSLRRKRIQHNQRNSTNPREEQIQVADPAMCDWQGCVIKRIQPGLKCQFSSNLEVGRSQHLVQPGAALLGVGRLLGKWSATHWVEHTAPHIHTLDQGALHTKVSTVRWVEGGGKVSADCSLSCPASLLLPHQRVFRSISAHGKRVHKCKEASAGSVS